MSKSLASIEATVSGKNSLNGEKPCTGPDSQGWGDIMVMAGWAKEQEKGQIREGKGEKVEQTL